MTEARHIALLGPANSVHLQRWAQALHENGRRVTVLSQQAHAALPLPAGVELVPLPVRGMPGYFINAWLLRRWLRQRRPHLLHAHYASGYGTTARLAGWRPTLLSVWGSDVYSFPYRGQFNAGILRRNLAFPDAIASTSEAMAEQVRRLLPAVGPIEVTPFGVDIGRSRPVHVVARARLVVGIVKTLAPAYGIDLLLQAFARLRPGSLRLLIVGDGPDRAGLQALAATLGIAGRVQWVGSVPHDDVQKWLSEIDIFAAPSRIESFGVAIVEAMAAGVPVVVSDAGGLPEVVAGGDAGLVVARESVDQLVAALQRLVDDPDLRRRLSIIGRKRAEEVYSWPASVARMMAFQDRVIAQTCGHGS